MTGVSMYNYFRELRNSNHINKSKFIINKSENDECWIVTIGVYSSVWWCITKHLSKQFQFNTGVIDQYGKNHWYTVMQQNVQEKLSPNLDFFTDSVNTQGGWLRFPLELFNLSHDYPFKVEDLLSGIHYDWNGEWNYVAVNPWIMPAHIFRVTLTWRSCFTQSL